MFTFHLFNSFIRVKIKAVRRQCFRGLAELPFLGKPGGPSDVDRSSVGGGGGFCSAPRCCHLVPKIVETSTEEGLDPLVNDSTLVLEYFPPRGNEKNKFGNGKGSSPLEDILAVTDDVTVDDPQQVFKFAS